MTRILLTAIAVACAGSAIAQTVERKVAAPTRLDWEFAVSGFGKGAAKLPAGYDSKKQKYQLFVPKEKSDKPAGLILFISPGDGPGGFKSWQPFCENNGFLFASPFGAGNSTPAGQRTRIILDVLDDVRRNHNIDPDLTYITGFSGGGRMACAIGFALPEYFGGVIPICGTNPISGPTYLRHRIEDRLSVAFVTGEKDFNRKENEEYMYPWFQEINIRSKLWVVPKMGHEVPGAAVIGEVQAWLAEDLERRRADRQAHPKLAVAADDTPAAKEQAQRYLSVAQEHLKKPALTWRGVALLQGVTQRWLTTESGKDAQRRLKDVLNDDAILKRVEEQGTADEVKSITAQAKALERFGQTAKAIEAWTLLAKNYEGTPVAEKAAENIKRLKAK
jgi:predicted esterase